MSTASGSRLLRPRTHRRAHFVALMAGAWFVQLALGASASVPTDPTARYGDRRAFATPPGSSTAEPRFISGERASFSPLVDEIVAEFSSADFDQRLRDLSGANSVIVGGQTYTFRTRHSFSEGGRKSWLYAYEQLVALGLAVRYQDYYWNGNHFQNVIATIPGEVTPERVYVLGGHIDSISPQTDELAPGAEDNGSGSSGVLAAAAVLAGRRFESTIELVLFSGEEQGLWGSDHYVDDALALGVDLRAAVTMDMIAYHDDEYGVLIEGENAWSELMNSFGDAVERYTSLTTEYVYQSCCSDHVPFQDAGIPAILAADLDWRDYPWYHSTKDTYDKTTPAIGVEIARAALATIAQLAGPLSTPSALDPLAELGSRDGPRLLGNPNPAMESVSFALSGLHLAATRALAPAGSSDPMAPVLTIIDANGRVVRSLSASGEVRSAPGWDWDLRRSDGTRVASGVYWARIGALARPIVVVAR